MKIRVENYKRISAAEVELEGVTVLVGPSNHGKTSFMQAIQAGLYGEKGDGFKKVGAEVVKIAFEFIAAGGPVSWIWRRSKLASLKVNNQYLKKIGDGVPREVLEAVDFAPVEAGGRDGLIYAHFQGQFKSLFGLRESGARLFNLLLSFSDFEKLPGIKRKIDKDGDELEIERKATETLRDDLDAELETLDHRAGLLAEAWVDEFMAAEEMFDRIIQVDDILADISDQSNITRELSAQAGAVGQLAAQVDELLPQAETFFQVEAGLMDLAAHKIAQDNMIHWLRQAGDLLIESADLEVLMRKVIDTERLVKELADLAREQDRAARDLRVSDEKLLETEAEIALFKVCPVCGAPVEKGEYHD